MKLFILAIESKSLALMSEREQLRLGLSVPWKNPLLTRTATNASQYWIIQQPEPIAQRATNATQHLLIYERQDPISYR